MKLKCLGSGSSGNCYILENEIEALIVDAGVPLDEVKIALDFNIRKIAGVLVTHCHMDHFGYAKDYIKCGIPVFQPYDHFKRVEKYGNFFIQPFVLEHDVPCYGFLIKHPDVGKALYITDTEYVKYRFKNMDVIIVEANYSNGLLSERGIDSPNRGHILTGHMSLETTKDFLKVNQSASLRSVILTHLSEHNADPDQFRDEAGKVVNCPVHIAKKGLEIDIGLPF